MATLGAQNLPPEIQEAAAKNIREMDLALLGVKVSDPDTPSQDLTYNWSFVSDPTGNAFFRGTDGSENSTVSGTSGARVGLRAGPGYPDNNSRVGQVIMVRCTVGDGENTVSADIPVTVVGVNRPPVLRVDVSGMGTQSDPRMDGEGMGLDARASSDPDSAGIPKMLWRITGTANGQTCQRNADLVLFGKETPTPGLVVPRVEALPSNPMRIAIEVIVEDGLIQQTETFFGYAASVNGCNAGGGGTPAPVVSAVSASPTQARFGQLVTLQASAPGGLSYSWVQLDTTGSNNTVQLSGASTRTATFTAPSINTTLRFRFTVSDNQNRSDSRILTVQVTPSGGGTGGTNPPPSGDSGTPTGTATGQTTCNQSNNQPAVATVPARFTIEGGNVATIRATNGGDPDNTQVFVNGIVTSGVSYQWRIVDSGGVLSSSALSGATTSTLRVSTPAVGSNRTARLSMDINDAAACGTRYEVELIMTPAANQVPNDPPTARMNFQVDGGGPTTEASGQTVTLAAPAEVVLDATGSSDPDGTVSYSFSMDRTLTQGGAVLSPVSEGVQRLVIQENTEGTVRVTVTVTDDRGATDFVTVLFVIEDVAEIPVASAAALVNGLPLEPGDMAEEGVVVLLDGSDSRLPDGSQPNGLTYSWRQVGGPPVNLTGANTVQAQFRAPELQSGTADLTFELVVRNGNVSSDPLLVDVTVAIPPLFFSQVAFGPLLDERFRTTLVLINSTDEGADDVTIEFFDPTGLPLPVQLDGEPWDPNLPLSIGASSSVMLPFAALDENLTVGWGRVDSATRLTGLVLYQLVDSASGALNSEVSLFASRRGSRFTTFYSLADGLAIALANPGDTAARVNIKLIDPDLGPDLPLATKPLILEPGRHAARFLNESYFGALPDGFESGTLVVEAVQGRVIATVLKTQAGVAISTLPLAVRR